jgi:hypothetical protein
MPRSGTGARATSVAWETGAGADAGPVRPSDDHYLGGVGAGRVLGSWGLTEARGWA